MMAKWDGNYAYGHETMLRTFFVSGLNSVVEAILSPLFLIVTVIIIFIYKNNSPKNGLLFSKGYGTRGYHFPCKSMHSQR